MKSASPALPLLTAALVIALGLAAPAAATTYLMATDAQLVRDSTAVVEARVLARDFAPGTGTPSTDYFLEVEEVLAGEVAGRNLVVRVPGGERPDGVGLRIDGMPRLRAGQRVLLFLAPHDDGTYGIRHYALGAFHEVAVAGQSVYVRDLQGAQELALPGLPDRSGYHRLRSAELFRRWVEAVGRGESPRAEYFLAPEAGLGRDGDPGRVSGEFRVFTDDPSADNPGGNRLPIRWYEFDAGDRVVWRLQAGGQPGFSAADTLAAFRAGMGTWNSDGGSNVDYAYVGTTPSRVGNDRPDGVNAMIYRNADGSITSGNFVCDGSGARGTLARGGPWYCRPGSVFTQLPAYDREVCLAPAGARFNAAFEAEITTNTGIECLFDILRSRVDGARLAQRALEALFAHELGHTLGIGHPCTIAESDAGDCPPLQSDALMFPLLHTDGRGAALNRDDRNAVRFLYPGGSSSGPVPAAPTDLQANLLTGDSVLLQWQDNSSDETGFVVETSIAAAGWEELATVDADVSEYLAAELEEETTYRFRVRSRNGNGTSVPSNEVEIETELGIPAAPAGLVAETGSATSALLTWRDRSDNEEDFVVEARTPASGAWTVVKTGVVADPDSATVQTEVEGLPTGVPHSFRVRARNSGGESTPSNVDAVTPAANPDGCTEDATTLCLLGDRFQVTVDWRNQHSPTPETGVGQANELSNRSGTFWFFREDNVELIVKVLDGTVINEFYWTFYGALSDVEYWVTVVDTEDGDSRTYYNAPGERCGRLDNASIPDRPRVDPLPGTAVAVPVSSRTSASSHSGACEPSATTLCLLDGEFSVEVDWVDARNDRAGAGMAVAEAGSDRTGYFWFFNETNIELVVKALDGRVVNGNYWFFYGALSDVEYEITVTHNADGSSRTYRNELGNQCGQFDDAAFSPAVE